MFRGCTLVFAGLLTCLAVIETYPVDCSLSDDYTIATHWLGVYSVVAAFFSQLVDFFQPIPVRSTCLPAGVSPQMHRALVAGHGGIIIGFLSARGVGSPFVQGLHIFAFAFSGSVWFYIISQSWRLLGTVYSCFHCHFIHLGGGARSPHLCHCFRTPFVM